MKKILFFNLLILISMSVNAQTSTGPLEDCLTLAKSECEQQKKEICEFNYENGSCSYECCKNKTLKNTMINNISNNKIEKLK